MDGLIEKVQNTLEMRNICIPDDYDIKNILVDYDSIDITDDIFEDIIAKFKNIDLVNDLLNPIIQCRFPLKSVKIQRN